VRLAAKIGLGVLATLAVIQIVRLPRSNPPVAADLRAPLDVKGVLERSCYDCHSNETRWPWYSRVAPVSWLVHHDVEAGRKALNFSDWNALPVAQQSKKGREIAESVAEGEMPPWYYVVLHPSAALSASDKSRIEAWAKPIRVDP
jgi:hypothetical protein